LLIGQIALMLALSACASGGVVRPPSSGPDVRQPVRAPVTRPVQDPQFRMEPGLEGVIGASQAQLARQFGNPRLDVWEGDARKLQFSGTPCILDIYLYPTKSSREPLAAYVEARRSDGRAVDKAACVQGLKR
jgi:hypothetical protein